MLRKSLIFARNVKKFALLGILKTHLWFLSALEGGIENTPQTDIGTPENSFMISLKDN